MRLEIGKFYPIEELISMVRAGADRDVAYAVYAHSGAESAYSGMLLFAGQTRDLDEEGNAVLPEIVTLAGLAHFYSADQFQDVVDLAFNQKPDASMQEVINCLNHYAEKDDFLDLV
ncbi:hypothetical protein [Bordetella genomosp. 13]|uniref:DUF7716 domain-containing protein n=1 Tax=Bordetella genomosp. 13 TaxID=463040 RepID=UPI0011A41F61|nr:hypothetical protein [Bordetella genomosp. 13]